MALVAVVSGAVGLSGCRPDASRVLVVGQGRCDPWATADVARAQAIDRATRDAHLRMLDQIWSIPASEERSVSDLMAASPYVEARVRSAIERSKVKRVTFSPDGRAEVVKELSLPRLFREAFEAYVEVE